MAGVAAAQTAVKIGQAAISFLNPDNKKDPERAAAARQALERAVGGDLASATYMIGQRAGSATDYGKQQFELAWAELEKRNPTIAAEALKVRINTATQSDSPSFTQKLKDQWNKLVGNVRSDVAASVNDVFSQAGPAAANAVDGRESYSALPFTKSQLMVAVAVLLAIAAVWYFSRARR